MHFCCSCCVCIAPLASAVCSCCFHFAPRLTFYFWLFSWASSNKITLKHVGCEISSSVGIQDCPIRNEQCSWPRPSGIDRGDGLLLSVFPSGVLFGKEILSSRSITKSHAIASNISGFGWSTASFIYAFLSIVVLLAWWLQVTLTSYQTSEIQIKDSKEIAVVTVQNNLPEKRNVPKYLVDMQRTGWSWFAVSRRENRSLQASEDCPIYLECIPLPRSLLLFMKLWWKELGGMRSFPGPLKKPLGTARKKKPYAALWR